MKTQILLLLTLATSYGMMAQSGSICDYSFNCVNDPLPDCFCSPHNPMDNGTYTVSGYGDLVVELTAHGLDFYCSCSSAVGEGVVIVNFSTGSFNSFSVYSAFPDGPVTVIDTIECVAPGDEFAWSAIGWSTSSIFSGGYGTYSISTTLINSPTDADVEPNQTLPTAISLNQYQSRQGLIGYGYDDYDALDLYRIDVPYTGTIVIEDSIKASLNMAPINMMGIWDDQGNPYMGGLQHITGIGSSWTIECAQQGDVIYVAFEPRIGLAAYGRCSEYAVSFDMQDINNIPSDPEPNDNPSDAIHLVDGVQVQGLIGYGTWQTDEYDYYQITVPNSGKLNVDAEFFNGGRVRLLEEDGTVMSSATAIFPGMHRLTESCVEEGEVYFVEIKNGISIVNDQQCGDYTLSFHMSSMASTMMDAEPNNAPMQAAEILADQIYDGQIGYGYYAEDSIDYYEVSSIYGLSEGPIELLLTTTGFFLDVQIGTDGDYTSGMERYCWSRNDWTVHPPRFSVSSGFCQPYTVRYRLAQENDLNNVNASFAQADTLLPDSVYGYHIGYDYGPNGVDDADYYLLTPPANGTMTITGYSYHDVKMNIYEASDLTTPILSNTFIDGILDSVVHVIPNALVGNNYIVEFESNGACGGTYLKYKMESDCPPSLVLGPNPVLFNGTFTYSASQSNGLISSSQVISADAMVGYFAPNVELLPGFNIQLGSELEVSQMGCP